MKDKSEVNKLKKTVMFSIVRSMWITFMHMFHKRETVQYPEQKNKLINAMER